MRSNRHSHAEVIDPAAREFYRRTMGQLHDSGVPFLVGGAYALARYTGIERHTKDFDIFVRPCDYAWTMEILGAAGCDTELTFPHWLGKARCGEDFIDVIFSSGNGIAEVDEQWLAHATDEVVLGVPVRLCPAEEMIWSKAFIMERERFDGADVLHLLRACGPELDWGRLLRRFDGYWRVLLAHLVLFGFVYPSERERVPREVMDELLRRLQHETHTASAADDEKVCRGTILSRAQYLIDIEQWGLQDGRLEPARHMTEDEVAHWTAAIGRGPASPPAST